MTILLSSLVFLTASPARGGEDTTPLDIVPVAEGEPAPFSGQLFPTGRAIKLGLLADSCQLKIDLEVNHTAKLLQIELDLERAKARIAAEAAEEREEILQSRIDEVQAWYRSPMFVAAATLVVAIGGVVATAYLVDAAGG